MGIGRLLGDWASGLGDRIGLDLFKPRAGDSGPAAPLASEAQGTEEAVAHMIARVAPSMSALPPTQDVQAEAAKLIAAHTSFFNLDEDGLGRTLAGRAENQAELVRAVYAQLGTSDRVQVARAMVRSMSDDQLRAMVWNEDGRALLHDLNRWVANNSLTGDGRSHAAEDRRLRERIGFALTRTDDITFVTTTTPVGQTPGGPPRELSGAEIPPGSNAEIRWELPASGTGYVAYNRNDTPVNYSYSLNPARPRERPRMPDQIGTRETIDRIQTLAREWYARHPDRPLQIGDISMPGGVDTPDHATHQNGRNVDVRPLRNDSNSGAGANLTYRSPSYDLELTKEFIRLVVEKYPGTTFYFNDARIYNDPEFKGIVTSSDRSHDNHLHIMFP